MELNQAVSQRIKKLLSARGFPFSFYHIRKPGGLPRFYNSAFPSFCAVWAPASGALALYYILQTYIIMYV